ncbi:Replication factor C subunit 4 [Smittium mucronatum]|uniref:Replication factor C subunit 4 n=1 Tax=Smittium mucronatum TaxID=133383 RepID=A0A1R0H6M7_9FUNG|nr:Replication factor C subunit 4 [Smittium mucronatum]
MFATKKQKSSSSKQPDANLVPWVEKYRPKHISDVVSQTEVVNVLKSSINSKGLPHLLFYGPPGTGKTSTILAFCRELFGPDLAKSRVLELNASDERGIQVVRNKIKSFAQTVVSAPSPNYPCPPYKIIILDEADSMTGEAQAALRRIMEAHSKITRFCLICNYVSRIIEPLASRCAKFRFKSLDNDLSVSRLTAISQSESVNISKEGIEALVEASNGDLRRAVMTLQSAYRLDQSQRLEPEIINDICGVSY